MPMRHIVPTRSDDAYTDVARLIAEARILVETSQHLLSQSLPTPERLRALRQQMERLRRLRKRFSSR
jgi:hypothetical protein